MLPGATAPLAPPPPNYAPVLECTLVQPKQNLGCQYLVLMRILHLVCKVYARWGGSVRPSPSQSVCLSVSVLQAALYFIFKCAVTNPLDFV
jgi:hypothetical protein